MPKSIHCPRCGVILCERDYLPVGAGRCAMCQTRIRANDNADGYVVDVQAEEEERRLKQGANDA